MSHALLFGLQITVIVFVGCYLDGYVLNDFQTIGFQTYTLCGIVCPAAFISVDYFFQIGKDCLPYFTLCHFFCLICAVWGN